MFLSDPSEAPIPSHPIFQADLLTTFIDEILYIYLAPCLATAFLETIFFRLKTSDPRPFTKYQAEMLTLDETLSLTFGKTMPEKKPNLNFSSHELNAGA